MLNMTRWGRSVAVLTAMLVFVFATLGSVSLGLRLPGIGEFAPFAASSVLDYSALPRTNLVGLDRSYITRVLGQGFPSTPSSQPPTSPARAGSSGTQVASLSPGSIVEVPPLSNDRFQDANAIGGVPFGARTRTTGATMQSSEPEGCTPVGGTVWFRYRAPVGGGLVASTDGSDYATTLAVYSGTQLGDLSEIGCKRDPRGNSSVALPAIAGATYFFQVGGPVDGGDLVFTLERQAATVLGSLRPEGVAANGDSQRPAISANGRYVAFQSFASDLDHRCPCALQVYVRDLLTGRTETVSVSTAGAIADEEAGEPDISADGRYVSFHSSATNLVRDDTNTWNDVFVRDRLRKTTMRVSVSSSGGQANDHSRWSHISANGQVVVFQSYSTNLVQGPRQVRSEIYIHNLRTKRTELISAPGTGRQADGDSTSSAISPDGGHVMFWSRATNLVAGATNQIDAAIDRIQFQGRLYTRDIAARKTTLEAVSANGDPANDGCQASGALSWQARYSIFICDATNLTGDAPPTTGADQFLNVFVRNRLTGEVRMVSVDSAGNPAPEVRPRNVRIAETGRRVFLSTTRWADISWDGRFVTFDSVASNLVDGDTNRVADVFVHDLLFRRTSRASVSTPGSQGSSGSVVPALSGDGRMVVFSSGSRFTLDDTNASEDVFIRL